MHILLTGGTGLIGQHLCQLWRGQGHRLTVWSRTPELVPKHCGTGVRGVARLDDIAQDDPVDAVINLAGRRSPTARGRRHVEPCCGPVA